MSSTKKIPSFRRKRLAPVVEPPRWSLSTRWKRSLILALISLGLLALARWMPSWEMGEATQETPVEKPPEKAPETASVALLLIGEPRAISKAGVRRNIKRNFMDTITKKGLHAFLFLTERPSDELLEIVKKDLGPNLVNVEIRNNTCPNSPASGILEHCCTNGCQNDGSWTQGLGQRGCLQNDAVYGAVEMARQYAKERGFQYDWYIRSRPDLVPFEPIGPIDDYSKDGAHVLMKELEMEADFMWIVPEEKRDYFFKRIVDMYKTCFHGVPEDIIFATFKRENFKLERHYYPIVLVREEGKVPKHLQEKVINLVECFRMSEQHFSIYNSTESLQEKCKRLALAGEFA